jgi:ATP-dependent DNA helicase PIF1
MAAIDLSKVFRHTDPEFIEVLNAIRSRTDLEERVDRFNTLCRRTIEGESTVTLCYRNGHAARINREAMDRLPGLPFEYPWPRTGQFDVTALPSPNPLRLKEGAKVMFTRNDPSKRWVNGTLGIIRSLQVGSIEVTILSENGDLNLPVEPVTWDAVKYELDLVSGRIEAKSKGTYTQFPLIPAWAITVHKCQGQSLISAVIDLAGGAFAHGQACVALSRCRSLGKMQLIHDLKVEDFRQGARVLHFSV